MRIKDLLSKDSIELNVSAKDKKDIIDKMTKLMLKTGKITDADAYKELVLKREEEGSTGVGEGIAIPHGKGDCVKEPGLVAMVVPNGVDYDALDGKPVNLLFMIAAPNTSDNVHLDVLSRLSTMLMDTEFKNKLMLAKSKEEFLNIINETENEKFKAESKPEQKGYEVLGITACPTGIAHTYMAAEALEAAGKEMGHPVKIETQGQSGVKNKLTKEEIKNAKAIIIAADIDIDLSRFKGKKILKAKVADGIHKPKELINRAIDGKDIPVYQGSGNDNDVESDESEGIGSKIYRHLMNGVTHMLPFVVGGGILIAISFLLDDYSIDPSNFGMNTPVAAFFKTIGNAAFDFMLCILAGYIAMSIADRPGLAVGFVGGALAKAGTTFDSISNPDAVVVSSGFLGALLAGFIGGYLVLLLKKIFSFIPKSLDSIKPILIYPVGGILLMGLVMVAINPVVGAINTALNNFLSSMQGANKLILGAILGGMMSVDLGGPVNKAAYTFGTGMLAEGHYDIMAAVMAGGMVPPIAIALLATFFPKKLPRKDRQSALLNYVMGLSFITEGAIPFASADPIRVIASCIVGSAVAGAMSMLFNCTLMAPHGGIFVIPVVGNALMYLVSIAVGSVVAMFIMAALKKNVWKKGDEVKNA